MAGCVEVRELRLGPQRVKYSAGDFRVLAHRGDDVLEIPHVMTLAVESLFSPIKALGAPGHTLLDGLVMAPGVLVDSRAPQRREKIVAPLKARAFTRAPPTRNATEAIILFHVI